MIIVRLRGGLGNQMFQYAAGLRLAKTLQIRLKLDLSWYKAYNLMHMYGLSNFKINEEIASDQEIRKFSSPLFPFSINSILYYKYYESYRKHFRFLNSILTDKVVKEQHFHFDSEILNIQHTCLLDGYWQSEKYFSDIAKIIRTHFELKNPPDPENERIIHEITNSTSVSVHIRRGDYINDPSIRKLYYVCDLNYFKNAMNQMKILAPDSHFYLFSNDPDWVDENLHPLFNSTVMKNNGKKNDYEDIRLMSLCKNNIICNSTFSWWAAWLNRNSTKTIIAPNEWFKTNQYNYKDVIPAGWNRISTLSE